MPSLRPRVFTSGPPVEDRPIFPLEHEYPDTGPLPELDPPSEDFRDEMPILSVGKKDEVETETYKSVTIRVPEVLYEEYRKVAASQDQTVEDVMQHRLASCKSHNALRGLWFSDSDRAKLEDLIQKRPLETPAQVLTKLSTSGTVALEGPDGEKIELSLTPAQKKVLKLRMYGGRTYKAYLEGLLRKELQV